MKTTMYRAVYLLSVLFLVPLCGCSRTFTIVSEDSPENRQNTKILNHSCDTGESALYMRNGEILKVHEVSLKGDSLSFVENIPETKRVVNRREVNKIITRDGVGSFIQGMGMSVPSAIMAGVIVGIACPPPRSGHRGLRAEGVIGFFAGLIAGFTAGEIIGVDKVFVFKQ